MPEWRPLRQKLRLFLSPLRPALQALTPAFPSELLSVLFVPSTRNTHPPSSSASPQGSSASALCEPLCGSTGLGVSG